MRGSTVHVLVRSNEVWECCKLFSDMNSQEKKAVLKEKQSEMEAKLEAAAEELRERREKEKTEKINSIKSVIRAILVLFTLFTHL